MFFNIFFTDCSVLYDIIIGQKNEGGNKMSSFSLPIKVDVHEVDFNGTARTSSLMRYIQSAAQMQLNEHGLSYNELYDNRHRAFLLSRITMEFYDAPREGAELVAETFPVPSRGFTFLRCYQLWHGDEIIGRAVSAWALIDTENHHLVKTGDFELPFPQLPALAMELSHVRVPSDVAQIGEYTVTYAEVDQNRHMNNTRYPDMYAHFLPMEGKRISRISISYRKEAPYGVTLRVLYKREGDVHYFRTLLPSGEVNSEAEVELAELK